MDKFQGKYRISSARLQNWDYANEGSYFITICTKNRDHFFGEIKNGKMNLSNIGIIADLMWFEIKNHSKIIELGEFVVMPNYIHGILILNGGDGNSYSDSDSFQLTDQNQNDQSINQTIGQKRFQNQGKNTISSIIGSYKSAVTKHCNRLGFEYAWQTRFHDHIIRDAKSFNNIQNYIANNPVNWEKDKFCDKNGKN